MKLEEANHKQNSDLFERERLSGKLMHADEVLTMSARMAIAAGNLEWETRYLSHEKVLDKTIQDAWSVRIIGNCLRQIDSAKNKRVEIEKKALRLVHEGQLKSASEVLESREYKEQKNLFHEGTICFLKNTRQHFKNKFENHRHREFLVLLYIVPTIFLSFMSVAFLIKRYLIEQQQARKELSDHEEAYRVVAQTANDAIIVIAGPYGIIGMWNKKAEEMFGYTVGEAVGKKLHRLIVPERYRRNAHDGLRRFFETGQGAVFGKTLEVFALRRDGSEFPVELSISSMRISDEWKATAIVKDITKRKKEEQKRLQLETIIEVSPDFIGFADAKDTHIIRYINPAGRRMCGLGSDEDVTKLKIDDVHPGWTNKLLAEVSLPTAAREGVWLGECAFLSRNGREIPVLMVLTSHRSERGEIEIFATISRDLTERKRMEDSLRESEEKYRQFFEAESSAIMLIDGETKRFVDANEAALKLFQYSKEEFLKLGPMDISAEPEKTKEVLEKLAVGEVVRIALRYLKKKDGTVFPVEAFSGSFMLQGRKVFFAVCRDISQRIEEEKKLKYAEKQVIISEKLAGIGQLAAGVSHEILNPLNIISIHVQMLQRSKAQDPELQKVLEKIKNEIARIEKINKALLTFSRKGKTERRSIKIGAELDTVFNLIYKEIELKNIKLVKEISNDTPDILADPDELRQVFLNIITNARYAMPSGGTLTVRAKPVYIGGVQHARIEIEDTGHGISKKNLGKIFTPFFTTKEEGKGTGLGLSVVHALVEKHGGTIKVESEEGKWTRFEIDLPCG